MKTLIRFLTLWLIAGSLFVGRPAEAEADVILHHGKIVTVDKAFSIHQALAIEGHRINPYNPFLGMATAITRRAKWYEGTLHPEEALTREQAIRFYTINNAWLLFCDDRLGSLEPGKLADLIVLDTDLLTCPEEAIAPIFAAPWQFCVCCSGESLVASKITRCPGASPGRRGRIPGAANQACRDSTWSK